MDSPPEICHASATCIRPCRAPVTVKAIDRSRTTTTVDQSGGSVERYLACEDTEDLVAAGSRDRLAVKR